MLRCLASHGLAPQRVTVGDLEVVLQPPGPNLPLGDAEPSHTYERHETPEQRAKREQDEFEELMYASSEGARFS